MRRSILLTLLILAGCGETYRDTEVSMFAVADFEPERFMGLWYEIARFPVPFQEDCTATTAEYQLVDAERVSILNTCRLGSPDGPVDQIEGIADIAGPGQLEVRFPSVPFVMADYVVLWVDEGYDTAVVGVPSGSAGWILARTPTIDPDTRSDAEAVLERNGYDTGRLIEVPHAP